jgi:Cd2+/Zn2+-exporting ATPase
MGLFSRAEAFKFKVSGMDCGGCESKITRTLTGIRGVKKVEASASQGSVSVTAKGVESDTLAEAIESVGFKVE